MTSSWRKSWRKQQRCGMAASRCRSTPAPSTSHATASECPTNPQSRPSSFRFVRAMPLLLRRSHPPIQRAISTSMRSHGRLLPLRHAIASPITPLPCHAVSGGRDGWSS
uniref:Uncharacterized protein n=1 Tax=Arundo donax TaxID=35708 RepID=A0A0A9G293_ARUDO